LTWYSFLLLRSQLEALARRLRGHRLVMVNTTKTGGGVAEILHRVVVILNELGVPTSWEVMEGDERFFNVTKKIHNALHGRTESLTSEDREVYAERTRHEAQRLALIAAIPVTRTSVRLIPSSAR